MSTSTTRHPRVTPVASRCRHKGSFSCGFWIIVTWLHGSTWALPVQPPRKSPRWGGAGRRCGLSPVVSLCPARRSSVPTVVLAAPLWPRLLSLEEPTPDAGRVREVGQHQGRLAMVLPGAGVNRRRGSSQKVGVSDGLLSSWTGESGGQWRTVVNWGEWGSVTDCCCELGRVGVSDGLLSMWTGESGGQRQTVVVVNWEGISHCAHCIDCYCCCLILQSHLTLWRPFGL